MKAKGAFVVTGASRGLGKAIAEAAYQQGLPVALISRSEKDLEAVRDELRKRSPDGPAISIHAIDLTQEKTVQDEFRQIQATHPSLRALVNNGATWMGATDIGSLSASDIQRSLDLNLFSAFHAIQAALKLVGVPSRQDFAVINIGATASLDAWLEVVTLLYRERSATGPFQGSGKGSGTQGGPRGPPGDRRHARQ